MDKEKIDLIFEKHLLLKSLNFVETKKQFSLEEVKDWISFFLNYLNPFFHQENFSHFQKK